MDIIMPWILAGGGIFGAVIVVFAFAAWLTMNEQKAEEGR